MNKRRFGDGFLCAEYKKDREDDQNIGPQDIDPLTLYVGNLAQEITKEDMVRAYPTNKRIDIGYAKKMKYTRYAFVSFKNINDSIEAFKHTHNMQIYSKSLIVRFRRLHGTVGMPGESRPQNQPKDLISENNSDQPDKMTIESQNQSLDIRTENDYYGYQNQTPGNNSEDMKNDWNFSDEEDLKKPMIPPDYVSPFLPGPIDLAFSQLRPKVIKTELKTEIKIEEGSDKWKNEDTIRCPVEDAVTIKHEPIERTVIKSEPKCEEEEDDNCKLKNYITARKYM